MLFAIGMGPRNQSIRGSGGQSTRMGNSIVVRQPPSQQQQQQQQPPSVSGQPYLYLQQGFPPYYVKQLPPHFSQVSIFISNHKFRRFNRNTRSKSVIIILFSLV